jgi:hypothetical protein
MLHRAANPESVEFINGDLHSNKSSRHRDSRNK